MAETAALRRILYVEDEPDIREVVKLTLETLGGYEVRAFASGQEALVGASEAGADLILLDVMMPGMDGPATLEALREIPQTLNTPVVFMTAKTQAADIQRYLGMGIADVIAKPFEPMGLPGQIEAIWAGWRSAQ